MNENRLLFIQIQAPSLSSRHKRTKIIDFVFKRANGKSTGTNSRLEVQLTKRITLELFHEMELFHEKNALDSRGVAHMTLISLPQRRASKFPSHSRRGF